MKTMRISIVAAGLLALAAAPALAQGTQIGAKGGVQWADFTEDIQTTETNTRLAWAAGGFFTYAFSPRFAIQPELLWTAKGTQVEEDGAEIDLSLTYAEIPVLFRLDFGTPMAGFRPYVMAGPYVAFESSCDLEAEENGVTVNVDCDAEGDADAGFIERKSTLFGLAAAAGFEIPLGDLAAVLVEGRFEQDLTALDDDPDATFEEVDLRNRIFGIYVGLSVPLRGAGY